MEVKIRTRKGVFNASSNWVGSLIDYEDVLKHFFNRKRLDEMAEIIIRGIKRDVANENKPEGGSLRPLKLKTLKYKKGSKLNETGRMLSQLGFNIRGDARIIKVMGDRYDVSGYLQFGTNKMAGFYWFGVSNATLGELKQYTEAELDKDLRKAA